jgi:hypothetical protein
VELFYSWQSFFYSYLLQRHKRVSTLDKALRGKKADRDLPAIRALAVKPDIEQITKTVGSEFLKV